MCSITDLFFVKRILLDFVSSLVNKKPRIGSMVSYYRDAECDKIEFLRKEWNVM